MPPLVSVIILAYNAERFLREAIESILNQSFRNFELLIINDSSTDSTSDIVTEYEAADSRVKSHTNPKNMGIPKSRNIGVELARGKYIAWLDSDDIAAPERLQMQVAFFEDQPEYALISSDLEIIDELGCTIGARIYPHDDKEIRKVLLRYNPFAQPASMLRRSVFDEVGPYCETMHVCEDYDLFLRISGHYRVANIPLPLLKYRMSTIQSKSMLLKKTISSTLKVQRAARKSGFPDSLVNRSYRVGLSVLLLVPSSVVLWFFNKATFIKNAR
ncbi:MAG: glycosyltransferase [Nitrospirae bacterium]|nr:glycosyltransferase [Nitrospirota bacterium]